MPPAQYPSFKAFVRSNAAKILVAASVVNAGLQGMDGITAWMALHVSPAVYEANPLMSFMFHHDLLASLVSIKVFGMLWLPVVYLMSKKDLKKRPVLLVADYLAIVVLYIAVVINNVHTIAVYS